MTLDTKLQWTLQPKGVKNWPRRREAVVVQQGIYALGEYNLNNPEEPYVVVHPYGAALYFPSYVERINTFLGSYTGPVITLEEARKCRGTAEIYKKTGIAENRFFIKTRQQDPKPTELSWDGVVSFLEQFGTRTVRLIGGYGPESPGCLGCLGVTAAEIRARTTQITVEPVFELIYSGLHYPENKTL